MNRLHKRSIDAVAAGQFFMRSLFDDTTALQNHDLVGTADGGEPVGNRDCGPACGQSCDSGLHGAFGARIQRAGCFIKERTGGLRKMVRATARRCFSPPENL